MRFVRWTECSMSITIEDAGKQVAELQLYFRQSYHER
jgi:hypothetical protein